MTVHEAKTDLKRRFAAAEIPFSRLKAKTVSFSDLARNQSVFVFIYGVPSTHYAKVSDVICMIPKPSNGGYIAVLRGKGIA